MSEEQQEQTAAKTTAIYGKKEGMTRVFDEKGQSVPVTVLSVTPNVVYQIKTPEREGYSALQVGLGEQKAQRVNKPLTNHFKKAKKGMPKETKEIRLSEGVEAFNVGDELSLEGMFEAGDKVDIFGTTKGKGFAGVIKRHGMKGAQTMTHGTHESFRHAGSIGCSKFPGRVFKNKRMAGHMGTEKRIQEKLEVVAVRVEDNALLVKGSVPGAKGSTVLVRSALKAKKKS